jgi:heme-degrading monooxygenase HmoA
MSQLSGRRRGLAGIVRQLPAHPDARHPASAHNSGMTVQETIVRMWRGSVRNEDTDEYVAYIERTGMREYRETPGNLDAWMLTRDLGDGTTEIVTVSRWQSLEAIKGFAGADIESAVYYPEDDRFLVERDDMVRHWTQVS